MRTSLRRAVEQVPQKMEQIRTCTKVGYVPFVHKIYLSVSKGPVSKDPEPVSYTTFFSGITTCPGKLVGPTFLQGGGIPQNKNRGRYPGEAVCTSA